LVKLDLVFTCSNWTSSFPATFVQPLSRPTSDHIPFVLHIGSEIPKAKTFRYENFWTQHPGFLETVNLHWNNSSVFGNAAKNLSTKFKQVRAGLKTWSKKLSNLNKLIYNSRWVLLLLDGLEEQRMLSRLETNFRNLVKEHLSNLLESKRIYWRQRNKTEWVNLEDENTGFFHSIATISHKMNFIVALCDHNDNQISDHEQKANLL